MDLDRSFWRTASVLFKVGGKWFVGIWILAIVTGLIPLVLVLMKVTSELEWWITLFALAIGIVITPYIAFHLLRIENDKISYLLNQNKDYSELLTKIAELRTTGVSLRNKGCKLTYMAYKEQVETNIDQWTQELLSTLSQLSQAEAERIRTLDQLTAIPPDCKRGRQNAEQFKTLRMLTQRLELLDEILLHYRTHH
jgi:hypothetical protein